MMMITPQGLAWTARRGCWDTQEEPAGTWPIMETGVTEQSSMRFDRYVKDRKPWRVFGTVMLQLSGLFNTQTYTKTKSTNQVMPWQSVNSSACVLSSTATKILTKREITPPTRRKIHGHELISHIIFHVCVCRWEELGIIQRRPKYI